MQIAVYTDNRLTTADCDSGKRETRPIVRESAPQGQDSNYQTGFGAGYQDRLNDRQL
jgi:hypothetical protein